MSDHPSVKAQPSAAPAPEVRHRAALTVADNVVRTGNDDLTELIAMLDLRRSFEELRSSRNQLDYSAAKT